MIKIWLLLLLIVSISACSKGNVDSKVVEDAPGQHTPEATTPPTIVTSTPRGAAGTLYAIELEPGEQTLIKLDVTSGVKQDLFPVPLNAWLASFDIHPDGKQFVFAYAPAPPAGEIQFGYTRLYVMDEGDVAPTLWQQPAGAEEVFFNPIWSPDGKMIYYSHVVPLDEEAYTFATYLKRLHSETGQIETIAENGIWPALSPDGTQLAYVTINPQTLANSLILAEPDGANPLELLADDVFTAVDAPVFSADGQFIYFSGVEPPAASRFWWDVLLGVQTTSAHNLPSDWYRLPIQGGQTERLTTINAVGLYGRFAPNGAPLFAFASQAGLFQMSPDGDHINILLETAFTDSLGWIP